MAVIPNSSGLGLRTTEPVPHVAQTTDTSISDGLGEIARSTAKTAKRIADNRAEVDSTSAFNGAYSELEGFLVDLEVDKDYDTQFERYQKTVDEISSRYSEGIKGSGGRAKFQERFLKYSSDQGHEVRSRQLQKDMDEQVGLMQLNLEQISVNSGNLDDPDLRDELRRDGLQAIQSAFDNGIFDDQETAEAAVAFQRNNAKADVRREIRNDPEAALQSLQKNEFHGLDAEENQIWQERSVRAAESQRRERLAQANRFEREAEKAEKRRADDVSREGDLLLRKGGLDERWIEDNIEVLSEEDRRYFYRKIDEGPSHRGGDIETYANLRLRAGTEDVREEARLSLLRGDIVESQYDKIVSRSERNASEVSLPNAFERAEDFIRVSLEPPDNFRDPLKKQRQASAVDEFFDWFGKNPDALDQQIQDRAKQIVDDFSIVNTNEILAATRRKTNLPLSNEKASLDSQIEQAVKRFELGEITKDEFLEISGALKTLEVHLNHDSTK